MDLGGRHRPLLDARASPLLPPPRDLRVRRAHRARGTHASRSGRGAPLVRAAGLCGGARALAALAGAERVLELGVDRQGNSLVLLDATARYGSGKVGGI